MKTTVITLPVAKFEWQNRPAITKTGKVSKTRTEWRRVKIADEQDFQGFEFNYKGKAVEVFVPTAHMTDDTHPRSIIYTKDGEIINALWQHGRYGALIHEEPALFDWKRQEMISVTSYCDGRVKDSYKYLIKVNF